MTYLIDSNIIIYHLNGDKRATDFICKNIKISSISRISYIEILSFDFNKKDVLSVKKMLNLMNIFDTSDAIANQCIINRKVLKIKIPDNLIASTAQVNGLVLVTRNVQDFKSLDIQLMNIYD